MVCQYGTACRWSVMLVDMRRYTSFHRKGQHFEHTLGIYRSRDMCFSNLQKHYDGSSNEQIEHKPCRKDLG